MDLYQSLPGGALRKLHMPLFCPLKVVQNVAFSFLYNIRLEVHAAIMWFTHNMWSQFPTSKSPFYSSWRNDSEIKTKSINLNSSIDSWVVLINNKHLDYQKVSNKLEFLSLYYTTYKVSNKTTVCTIHILPNSCNLGDDRGAGPPSGGEWNSIPYCRLVLHILGRKRETDWLQMYRGSRMTMSSHLLNLEERYIQWICLIIIDTYYARCVCDENALALSQWSKYDYYYANL